MRRDWAVAAVIKSRVADAQTVSVALVEVYEEHDMFSDYGLAPDGADLPFDYVIFTPRVDQTDHCAELAERFGKKQPQKGR